MNNFEKYHFADFTYASYRDLLKIAKKKFVFKDYNNFEKGKPFLLWRHDVDFSLHNALELAEIEAEEGITSTYFILLHSEFYNPLEKETSNIVRRLTALGHHIGLHFDTNYYNIQNESEIDKWIRFEKKFLENLLDIQIGVFSFHNTTEFILSCKKENYGGLLNTYASFFQEEAEYCSDSYGIWRFKRLKDLLEKGDTQQLQILTHPEWWTKKIMSPKERIWRTIDGRANANKNRYLNIINQLGSTVIDW